jgi:DNA-directed RNA polymerase specialized sigma24 family protein
MEDSEAWEAIIAHRSTIESVVYKTTAQFMRVDADERQELCSHVIETLARGRMAKWSPDGGLSQKNWIAMATKQLTLNAMRRKIPTPSEDAAEQTLTTETPLACLLGKEQTERLQRAVATLSDADRALYRAICDDNTEQLGLTPVQLCRARKRLIANIQAAL